VFPYSNRRHVDALAGAPALELDLDSVSYPGSAAPALQHVHLSVPVGARVALVGHNGAGKSTLLKAVAGLLPFAGRVRICGLPIGACHHRVAYLPQHGEIDWRFPISLRKLVLTGRYVHLGWLRRPTLQDYAICDALIERLGLAQMTGRQIAQLSGGQQQRALLARALAQEAELLLLDEPLIAVDAETRTVLAAVMDELRGRGRTLLVATHDVSGLATEFDSVVFLSEGRVVSAAVAPPQHAPLMAAAHPQ